MKRSAEEKRLKGLGEHKDKVIPQNTEVETDAGISEHPAAPLLPRKGRKVAFRLERS
jgi:hypothetical protein